MVTGASAGVGRAVARAFGAKGACVGLLARGVDGLNAAKQEIENDGGNAIVLQADVADYQQVYAAAKKLADTFGPIDVWVNNAMVSVFSPVKEMSPEEYQRVTNVTYLGYVHGTLAALKQMEERNYGIIIQIGSALSYRSIPLQSAYCAAKHAVMGFTESLRTELLHDQSNIQVCVAQLPAVNTPQFDWVKSRLPKKPQPVPPIFQPEVIADAVVWLSHHPRRELYIGASTAKAIIADKIAPGLADRYLARNGYDSQQTEQPEVPDRPHNLWQPVTGDHGAHGRFDENARGFSIQFWLSKHKIALATTAASAVIAYLAHQRSREESDEAAKIHAA